MRLIRITSIGTLSLLIGIAAPVYAQQEQGEKQDHHAQQQDRPKPQQEHAGQQKQAPNDQQHHAQQQKQAQNSQQQEHAQQQKQAQSNQQQEHAQQQKQAQNSQQQHNTQPQRNNQYHPTQAQQRVQQAAWKQHGSQHWEADHRTWQQRGGYHGYRIPDYRYRGYFGTNHGFRIYGLPFLVVAGYPRFQYEGYWFSPIDPWPEYWGDNWYDNDEVYVAYVDNGYYLYNRRYPTVGIAINVSM